MNSSVSRDFDPNLYLLDRRILPQRVAFQDKENSYVWVHPDDLSPARIDRLKEKLRNDCSVRFPSVRDDNARNTFLGTLENLVPKNPNLSDETQQGYSKTEVKQMSFDAPLSSLVHNISNASPPSDAQWQQQKDAVAIYFLLEYALEERGYPTLLKDTVAGIANRGTVDPEIERLFHELRDPLKLSTTELMRVIRQNGVQGVASLLEIDLNYVRDVRDMVDVIAARGMSINDVINWKVGRTVDGMQGASVQAQMEVGLHQRVDIMIAHLRDALDTHRQDREEHKNEHMVAASLAYVPPVLARLFFEEGGQIIFTQEPDLRNLMGVAATGYHVSFHPQNLSLGSLNHIYVSQDLGLPDTIRTLVHEMHHLFYPEPQFISAEQAQQADALLASDQARLHTLKRLADAYEVGDDATKQEVIQIFASMSPEDMPFADAMHNVSMATLIGAINESYHFLQMESPTYNRISTYHSPLDRYREVIPRYSEMRFVEHSDHKEMLAFIVPGITKIYKDVYIPHLEARLEYLLTHRPSLEDQVIQAAKENPAYGIPPSSDLHPPLQPWYEQNNGILIEHPIGDTRSVGNGFTPATLVAAQTRELQGAISPIMVHAQAR